MSLLPVMPFPGRGAGAVRADLGRRRADCVMAALRGRDGRAAARRYELAGPEALPTSEIVRAGAALARPPAAARRGSRLASSARAASCVELLAGPTRVRHLGRGRAAGGPAGSPPRHRRRGAARGARRGRWPRARRRLSGRLRQRATPELTVRPRRPALGPRQRLLELRGEREQRSSRGRAADQLDGERQPVVAVVQRQRDRGLAGDVEDRRERRELARAAVVAPRVGAAAVDLADRAAGAARAPA